MISNVVLNEIAAHTDYADPARPEHDSNDWIEVRNTSAAAVSLSGWYLSDDAANLRKWRLPDVVLGAGERISFDEVSGFHTPTSSGFGIDKAGEQIFLSKLSGTFEDRVADSVRFGGQDSGVSLGRVPDGTGIWQATVPTRDAENRASAPPLVISEVMYHPAALESVAADRDAFEYVEIWNPGSTPALPGTNGSWRLAGGISFDFPAPFTIPARGCIVAVNFDPRDAAANALFRRAYPELPADAAVFGPYTGKLADDSDRVALQRPISGDVPGEPLIWITLDELIYSDRTPWFVMADGLGESLHRTQFRGAAILPENWSAATPSPGWHSAGGDSDGDGLPDEWEMAHGLDAASAADGDRDSDGDRASNLTEFLTGTDPRNAASVFRMTAEHVTVEGNVLLQFHAMSGRSYSIEYRDALVGDSWRVLQSVNSSPEDRAIGIRETVSGSARFYRLVTPAVTSVP
jgi:hypothetical protein